VAEEWGVGHPTGGSTINDPERWAKFLASPECAEEECLDAALMDGTKIRGHVWYGNGYYDTSFPEHLRKYCFGCAYWHSALENANAGTVIIRRSNSNQAWPPTEQHPEDLTKWHYCFDPREAVTSNPFRGFGGHRFKIHFLDGRKKDYVETNNLWSQGDIPDWLDHYFEVNAEFVEEEKQDVKIDWSDL